MKTLIVGDRIIARVEGESNMGSIQRARGYAELKELNDQEISVWLIPGSVAKKIFTKKDMLGNTQEIIMGHHEHFESGLVISKNSPLGNALAELKGTGAITYMVNGKAIKKTVISKASYNINKFGDDATDGEISCADENLFPFEDSLKSRLKELRKLLEETERLADVSKEDVERLKANIQKLEQEIQEKSQNAKRYRRTTNSLREQFLLDTEQNKLKRTNLFNGALVIDGGPGTGKTTLLIHRIQYLLDPEIENDEGFKINLTSEDRILIRSQKTGWIFFSPTPLLKKYLENAMTSEGLEAFDETVKTWDQQRSVLKFSMGFFNAEKMRPFQSFKDKEPLWKLSSGNLKLLIESFDSAILSYFLSKCENLGKQNIKGLHWEEHGRSIIAALTFSPSEFSLRRFIVILNDLHERFNDLRVTIDNDYRSLMENDAANIQNRLTEDDKKWFADYLKERKSNRKNDIDETEEQEEEDLIESFEEEEIIEGKKLEIDISKTLKRVLRIAALSKLDPNTKLKAKDILILDRIEQYNSKSNYEKIASLSLFIKYFKPLLKGSDTAILTPLSRIYKTFRRNDLKNEEWLNAETKEKLNRIINTAPINTRLHDDELDFLILAGLRLGRLFYEVSPQTLRESTRPVLVTYAQSMKSQVAIDEATDFSPTQLLCMYNLSNPRWNAVSISGDLMQQMNDNGIDDWNSLSQLLPNLKISTLVKSYRQTNRLLKLATQLYTARFGKAPGFYSSEAASDKDPAPLVIISQDFNVKINWIADRIVELFSIYEGIIPNIAIFVKNDNEILNVTQALNNNELIVNHGIQIKACIGEGEIGSANFVRVFNVSLIKGMEFESVFFWDVDDYDSMNSQIVDKLIYVGVSRATYYLGITLNQAFPQALKPVEHEFETGNWSKDIDSDY